MSPNNVLVVDQVGDTLVIEPKWQHTKIALFGTTIRTNTPSTETREVEQLVLFPEQGKGGLLAILVRQEVEDGRKWITRYHSFFIEIKWKSDKHVAELSSSWVSTKVPALVTEHGIEVELPRGKRVSSGNRPNYSLPQGAKGPLLIKDGGDLLCEYLFEDALQNDKLGETTLVRILHAAVQEEVEPIRAKKIESLTRDLHDAHAKNRKIGEQVKELESLVAYAALTGAEARLQLSSFIDTRSRIARRAINAIDSVPRWVRWLSGVDEKQLQVDHSIVNDKVNNKHYRRVESTA